MTTRIGKQIHQALLDQKVTKAEIDSLLAEANANGTVSATEKKELTLLLKASGDQFDADARSALSAFLVPTPPPPAAAETSPVELVELSNDPTVLTKHSASVSWTAVESGQLFKDGVSFDDVLQGSIADCFFVGALSAVAHANPKAIEDCIKDNADGTYTARFFSRGPDGQRKADFVRVDGDIPARWGGGSSAYAKSRDSQELWVTLVEKAYASWKGGYEALDQGGHPAEVLTAITGSSSSYYLVENHTPSELFELIESGVEMGAGMTALTFGEDQKELYQGTGIHPWHNYTVMGAVRENGEKYVQLRNPWGCSEPGSDGADDGIFKMSVYDFAKLYQGLSIN